MILLCYAQLFKRPHPARKVFSYSATPSLSAPPVAMDTTRVFYKNLTQLMPSREPLKGKLRAVFTSYVYV